MGLQSFFEFAQLGKAGLLSLLLLIGSMQKADVTPAEPAPAAPKVVRNAQSSGPVPYLSDAEFGAVGDCSTDDTAAIQAGIDAAINQQEGTSKIPGKFSLRSGMCYTITSTLIFQNARDGIFEGNGARIHWAGDDTSPAILLSDVRDTTLTNFSIECTRANPLHTAIRMENGTGQLFAPTSDVLDHIVVEAVEVGALKRGVHVALGPGGDANNENHALYKVKIRNYTDSAFRIDHSQAKNIQFRDCECTADPSSPDTTCLTSGAVNGGSYHWYGGSGGGNSISDFYIANPTDTISIQTFHSERSKRFLTTGGPSGAPMALLVSSVRFAADQMAADRIAIDYRYPGPLMIQNSLFGEQQQRLPRIRLTSLVPAFAVLQGNLFAAYNSVQEDPLELIGGKWEVLWANNAFVDPAGSVLKRDAVRVTTASPAPNQSWGNLGQRVAVPSSSSMPCSTDQWAADSQFLYVCQATNNWKRVQLSSW